MPLAVSRRAAGQNAPRIQLRNFSFRRSHNKATRHGADLIAENFRNELNRVSRNNDLRILMRQDEVESY